MHKSIAIRPQENTIQFQSSIPNEHEMMVYHTMAEQAVGSKFYGNSFKDKSAVMMIMLSARELGIPPCQALNGGINMIQGKVEISARMMSALIRKAGHRIKVIECTPNQCIIEGSRCDTGECQKASFSLAEAQTAGLVKAGGGWTKWPKDMCFARALSRLARQLFSDVIGIGYVEGEISQNTAEKISFSEESEIEEVEIKDEETQLSDYLNLFDKEDKYLAHEYLKAVQKQFDFTIPEAIKTLTEDKNKLFDKFNNWKSKYKKTGSNE